MDDHEDSNHGHTTRTSAGRRRFLQSLVAASTAYAATGGAAGESSSERTVTDIFVDILEALPDTWGKWGSDDELGALNYLGSSEAFSGLQAALRGGKNHIETFPLQLSMTGEIGTDPQFPPRRPARKDNIQDARDYDSGDAEPFAGGFKYTDDAIVTRFFLQSTSHLDALGHPWYGEQMYNGVDPATTHNERSFDVPTEGMQPPDYDSNSGDEPDLHVEQVTTTFGLGKLGIENVASTGVVGRAVLLDIGRYKKDDPPYRLGPGECVTLEDLQNTAESQGVKLRKRDILLMRTGAVERARDDDPEIEPEGVPSYGGLCFSQDLVEWIHSMEIPILIGDNAVEAQTNEDTDPFFVSIDLEKDLNADLRAEVDTGDREELVVSEPLHLALITNLGVYFGELFWLKDLADRCAEDGIYDFLLAGSPLHVEGGTGGPFNPVAIKATRPN